MKLTGTLAAAVCGLTLCAATAANATVTVKKVADGTLSVSGNSAGTIKAMTVSPGSQSAPNVYDFTFKITDVLDSALTQVQASIVAKGVAQSLPISYSIFSGVPNAKGTGGTLVASSQDMIGSSLAADLKAGSYYIQLDDIAKAGELVSGSIDVSAVPEPAEWALFIFGFGLLGGVLRNKRQYSLSTAV